MSTTAKLKRFDTKKMMLSPFLRRYFLAEGTISTQAREGIDVSREYAYQIAEKLLFDKFGWTEHDYESPKNLNSFEL